jgi:hypothetical protein
VSTITVAVCNHASLPSMETFHKADLIYPWGALSVHDLLHVLHTYRLIASVKIRNAAPRNDRSVLHKIMNCDKAGNTSPLIYLLFS